MAKIWQRTVTNSVARECYDPKAWLILAGLTALAAAMRFYNLDSVPAGLHYDEAFNGLDALSLLDKSITEWPIFFNGNYGREPLFIWLLGIAHWIFGPSLWTTRLVSALSGVFLIPAMAWLGWQLAPSLGVRYRQSFSLWCPAAVLALLWSQVFARYGIRPNLFVLVETLLFAAAWQAWHRPAPAAGAWLLNGLLAGLSFYTYLPARLLPFLFLSLLVVAIIQDGPHLSRAIPGLLIGITAAFLVAAPLSVYFLQNPVAFLTRVEQVTTDIGSKELYANLFSALGLFLHSGDKSVSNNLPHRPALDPLLAPFFLIGLLLAMSKFWKLSRIFLLGGFVTFLLPTVFSDWAPNFKRAIGVIPFIGLLTALGADGTIRLVYRWSGVATLRVGKIAVWVLLSLSIVQTNFAYFRDLHSLPEAFYAWTAGYMQLASHIDGESVSRIYVSPRDPTNPNQAASFHPSGFYLLAAKGVIPHYHDDRHCIRVALSESARYFRLPASQERTQLGIDSYYSGAAPPRPVVFDHLGNQWATEFRKTTDNHPVFPEMLTYNIDLADGISLQGYSFSSDEIRAGQPLDARLYWRVHRTPSSDYTLFFHILHEDENGSMERLASFDRPPGEGACPMTEWLPGEVVIDHIEAVLPESLPAGELYISFGFYLFPDGGRMQIAGTSDNSILIGPLSRNP